MQYQEYIQQTRQVSQLVKEACYKEAVDALYQLILSDVSDIDKAALCAELAGVYDRLGNSTEAEKWYEKAVSYELNYCRYDMTEKKAHYLSQLGHNDQAVQIYESIMKQPFVSESEKERMRKVVQSFLGKSMHGWQ